MDGSPRLPDFGFRHWPHYRAHADRRIAGTRPSRSPPLRPPCHEHAKLRGDNVEPLGGVFTDHDHGRPAARAGCVLRRQLHLDPWQVSGQFAAVSTALSRTLAAQIQILPLSFGVALGDRYLEVLEIELQLLLGQPLRIPPELQTARLQQQVRQPLIAGRQVVTLGNGGVSLDTRRVAFGRRRISLGHRGQQQRT